MCFVSFFSLSYFSLGEEIVMAKKHFMCTHTWVGDEAKQMGLEATGQMTDREFFA